MIAVDPTPTPIGAVPTPSPSGAAVQLIDELRCFQGAQGLAVQAGL